MVTNTRVLAADVSDPAHAPVSPGERRSTLPSAGATNHAQ